MHDQHNAYSPEALDSHHHTPAEGLGGEPLTSVLLTSAPSRLLQEHAQHGLWGAQASTGAAAAMAAVP